MENITAQIKTTRNNQLAAQVKTADLKWAYQAYEGERVSINGKTYQVTGVGNPFGGHGDVQVYLYIVEVIETAQAEETKEESQEQAETESETEEQAQPEETKTTEELKQERRELAQTLQACEHGAFPGSPAWRESRAAMDALQAFDDAHPEVLGLARREQVESVKDLWV